MYQLATHLVRPYTFLYTITIVALAIFWWRQRALRRKLAWVITPFLLLGIASNPYVAYLACGTLEWNYPLRRDVPPSAKAIVVLGGGVRLLDADGKIVEPARGTMYRCVLAAELYHQHRLPIYVCGGKVDPSRKGQTIARCMADLLTKLGVDRSDIVLEDQSRTTYEDALYVHRLLAKKKITEVVLVTDALHLARSEMCFHAFGIQTYPRGAYYRAAYHRLRFTDVLPSSRAMRQVDLVAHEWIGIAWYLGKTGPS